MRLTAKSPSYLPGICQTIIPDLYLFHCNTASLDYPSPAEGMSGITRTTEDYEHKCLNAVWLVNTELG
jgi:hypothetical protein